MQTDRFSIYETNADLEQVKFIGEYSVRDIAETRMWHLFKAADYSKDFFVMRARDWEIVSMILSAETQRLRGECQG